MSTAAQRGDDPRIPPSPQTVERAHRLAAAVHVRAAMLAEDADAEIHSGYAQDLGNSSPSSPLWTFFGNGAPRVFQKRRAYSPA
ncbi:MAG: hypothetical protein JO045_03150 [Mycobacterium sp.]|nr:hypothetical protein [Mycobacterium sp.]